MMLAGPSYDRAVLTASLIASTIPLWFVAIPPLIDLLGHMGRYHLQLALAGSPQLQAHWDLHWMLIGNLGVDLVMQVLGRIVGVERGAWLVAMAIPPLMIWGIVRLARAFHGHVPATVVASFPLALAYVYQVGLVNYWLAIAFAFHASASVIGHPERWGRPLLLGASTVLLWICHIFGWAIFAGIVAASRLAEKSDRSLFRRLVGLWPLATPLVLMIYQNYGRHADVVTMGWFWWGHKFSSFVQVLRDQDRMIDFLSLALVLLPLIAALLFRQQFMIDRRSMLASGGLFAAALLLPYQLFGSAYADARLWPVVLILAILAIAPRAGADPLWSRHIPMALLALFAVRIGFAAVGYAQYDRTFRANLAALDHVERGSRIAYLVNVPCDRVWRRTRLEHLDGIAIVRRDVFTNGQWDVPGAETVVPIAARGTWANSDPSQMVRTQKCITDQRPTLAKMITALPRDRFDYVWVMDFDPATLPLYPWLQPLYANDQSILYRIRRP